MFHWIRRHPYITIAVLYVAVRIIVIFVCGFKFDMRPLIYFDQTLDPILLRDRLLESLWYCHTQPPVMNFVIGVGLKIFGPSATAFYLWNAALGLLGAFALYELMRRMRIGAGVSVLFVLLLFLGPTALVSEQQLFYDYPLMACMCVAGLLLHRYATNGSWRDGLLFFGMVAIVALTRSLYHPIWLVGVIAALVLARRAWWRRTVLVGLPALVVVVGWYVKNLVIFGGFFGSSWMGANLHSPAISKVPHAERVELIAKGEFSPASFTDDPFVSLDSFRTLGYTIKPIRTGIPALDMERRTTGAANYNNPNYIDIHKDLERDAKKIIMERPMLFARSLIAAAVIYCTPPSEVWSFYPNRLKIIPYDYIYNKVVFGQVNYWAGREYYEFGHDTTFQPRTTSTVIYNLFHAGIFLLVMIPLLTVLSVIWWWKAWRRGESVDAMVYGYIAATLLFTAVIGNLFSVAENNRYRFVVDPYYLLLAGVLWERWRARQNARKATLNPAPADPLL